MHTFDLYINCCKGAVNITRKNYRYICNYIRELKKKKFKEDNPHLLLHKLFICCIKLAS